MEKSYYGAASLRRALDAFEQRYGMTSAAFYAAYVEYDEAEMKPISGFHRHSWASFYRDWRRLSGDGFAATIERELQMA